jgi:outer membrane immunogenic protein
MKQFTLTFAVLCAACALTFGGPEPMQPSGKNVVESVAEASCFQGWYFGVHGGGLLSNFDRSATASEASLGARGDGFADAFDRTETKDGWTGEAGLHAGYNFQRGGWIFGLEADLSASAFDEHARATAVFDGTGGGSPDLLYVTDIHSRSTVDWYSTLRPRFGHTLGDRVFIYGTGGLAFGMAELQENTRIVAIRPGESQFDARDGFSSNREIKVGWTGGAGIDFCLTQHWILNFTYLYVDLGHSHVGTHRDFDGFDIAREFNAQTTATSNNAFHTFQGGLSFKF